MIRTLEAGRADRFNFDRIHKTFHAALEENGFRPEVYDRYMTLFAQTLAPKEPITSTRSTIRISSRSPRAS